jgi:hypothetical protein
MVLLLSQDSEAFRSWHICTLAYSTTVDTFLFTTLFVRLPLYYTLAQAVARMATIPQRMQHAPPSQSFEAVPLRELKSYAAPVDCPLCGERAHTSVHQNDTPDLVTSLNLVTISQTNQLE